MDNKRKRIEFRDETWYDEEFPEYSNHWKNVLIGYTVVMPIMVVSFIPEYLKMSKEERKEFHLYWKNRVLKKDT